MKKTGSKYIKRIYFVLLCVCVLGLNGCSDGKKKDTESQWTETTEKIIESETITKQETETENKSQQSQDSQDEKNQMEANQADENTKGENRIDAVNSPLFGWELFASYIDDKPEVIYEDEKEISILNNRVYYVRPAANGTDYRYGLTFDKETYEPKYLYQYIPSLQTLIQAVEAEEYSVVYGEFWRFSKDEIIVTLQKALKEENWSRYYSNFYIDKEYIYVIVEGTASGYSSIKLPRSYFEDMEEIPVKKESVLKMEAGTELSAWETYTPNFYDTVKMMYNSESEVSITFMRPYYVNEVTEQKNLLYGLTIDKENNKVKSLGEYVTSSDSLAEKLKEREWEEGNWNGYSNFYIEGCSIYIIINELYEDYSVIPIER